MEGAVGGSYDYRVGGSQEGSVCWFSISRCIYIDDEVIFWTSISYIDCTIWWLRVNSYVLFLMFYIVLPRIDSHLLDQEEGIWRDSQLLRWRKPFVRVTACSFSWGFYPIEPVYRYYGKVVCVTSLLYNWYRNCENMSSIVRSPDNYSPIKTPKKSNCFFDRILRGKG